MMDGALAAFLRFFRILPLLMALAGLWLIAAPARAEHLHPPTGDVVLIVSGAIGLTNVAGEAHLDRAMLEEIGLEQFATTTLWTDGPQVFEGVSLHRLMEHLRAQGHTLRVEALNDYEIEIPASEVEKGGPLLAMRVNGVSLSPRDKGPIWMVFPYDSDARFRTDLTYARSVWQLGRIEILP